MLLGGKNLGNSEHLEQAGIGPSYADSDQSTKQGYMHAVGSCHIEAGNCAYKLVSEG